MTESIQIVVEAIAGNTAALKDVQTKLTGINTTSEKISAQQKNFSNQFKSSWTEINSMLGVATQAFRLVNQAVDATVGSFVKYADQVRKISQVTGESTESVSRLLQVTDDYKISSESLTVVMKKMASEGFAFTTDSLADLSDVYLKLQPGVERQIFLNEKFGRQGVEFAEIMLAGGKAIRSQSDAVSKSLILTGAAVKKAREYEIAQDNLNDSIEGLKIRLGQDLIPTLIKTVDAVSKLTSWVDENYDSIIKWGKGFETFRSLGLNLLFDALGKAIFDTGEETDTARMQLEMMSRAAYDAAKASKALSDAQNITNARLDELNYVLGFTEDGFKKAAIAALITKASIDGVVSQEEIDYIYGLATSLGVLTQQEIDAALKGLEFQNMMLAIMDMPAEVQKKFILNVEMYGWEAAKAFMDGMGNNQARQSQSGSFSQQQGGQQGQSGSQTKKTQQWRAGGGSFSGWAMVGDSKGGGMTPYTEWVYAPHGAVVYNQSQMSGKSAPPMAGGGMIPPISNDINLSDKSIRDLADALAYKMAQVQ
jgi:hypothetical protein